MSKQPPQAVLAGVLSAGLIISTVSALPAVAAPAETAPAQATTSEAAAPQIMAPVEGTETIALLTFNDFHGALSDKYTGTQFADTVEDFRRDFAAVHGQDKVLLTSAGDLIGASASVSNVQQDEPTLEIMNALGLAVSAAGNHEFDKGLDDLTGRVLGIADFEFLAANFVDPQTKEPVLPAYEVFEVGGTRVAVIGAVPNELYATTTGEGLKGNQVIDLVEGVNAAAAQIEANDEADVIVASYHEGASGNGDLATELQGRAEFTSIVNETDPAVDVIFNGHTHQTYRYETDNDGVARPILQTGQSGNNLGVVELQIDSATQEIRDVESSMIARSTQAPAEAAAESGVTAEVYALEQAAVAEFRQAQSTVIGEMDASITTDYQTRIAESGSWRAGGTRRQESTLGNWAAEAIKDRVSLSNSEVDLGVTNAGGLRAELLFDKFTSGGAFPAKPADLHGKVTLGEILDFAPFGNTLVYFEIPGSSLKKVLEENWREDKRTFTLGWSDDLRWTYDETRPQGDQVTGLWIDGEAVQMDQMYTVATLSFLADTAYLKSGSSAPDGYTGFAQGRQNYVNLGIMDNQAFQEYVAAQTAAEGHIAPNFSKVGVEVEGAPQTIQEGQEIVLTLDELEMDSDGAGDATSVDVAFEDASGTLTELGSVPVAAGGETVTLSGITAPAKVGAGELVMTVNYDDKYASTTQVRSALEITAGPLKDFADNQPGSIFYSAVRWMQTEGISTGYTDGNYRKNQSVTRGEAVTFLYRYLDPSAPAAGAPYRDVPANHPFAQAITWAQAAGVSNGYTDRTFRPGQPVTRAEFASFLYRAVKPKSTAVGPQFDDVPASSTHYAAINWMASEGITLGYKDGTFRPSQQISRGEIAAMLHRYDSQVNQD